MSNSHNISDVATLTGIPKDLLRMWERRYGYPNPERDENGNRAYSQEQVEKLLLIRQLVDQGKRPGKLVAMTLPELQQLIAPPQLDMAADDIITFLKQGQVDKLRTWLHQQMHTHGLRSFIHQVLAPAIQVVGNAWEQGKLAVYEEHLFTEIIKGQLRKALAEQDMRRGHPRIMLTTVTGEQHSLGLLMVETLLRLGGADVIPFGTEMPFQEIRNAAESHKVDVIGLSFSANFKTEDAIVMLAGLRQMISSDIAIWTGGNAFADKPKMPDGVKLLEDLQAVEQALVHWQPTASSVESESVLHSE